MLKYMNVRELWRGSFNIRHVYVWRMHSATDKLTVMAAAAHMARRTYTAAVER
jgi:hypothetical protein